MNQFAIVFNRHIKHFGISNQKIAEVMGSHYTSIGRWRKEEGSDHPTDENMIRRFAEHYRLTGEELNELLDAAGFVSKPVEVSSISSPQKEQTSIQQVYNPFITGQPVSYGHFFGREVVIDNLYRLWRDFPRMPIQNAAIWGEKRIGKTSLLRQLKALASSQTGDSYWRTEQNTEKYAHFKVYNWVYADFQNVRVNTQCKFLQYIVDNLHLKDVDISKLQLSNDNPLEQFIELCADYLTTPTVILLDEVSAVLEHHSTEFSYNFWEGLRALSTTVLEPSYLGFVISSSEHPKILNQLLARDSGLASPFFNIFGYVIELQAFNLEEANSLINSSPIAFSDVDKEFIIQQSQCKPNELQNLCRQRLDMLINGVDKNNLSWQKETTLKINKEEKVL